MTGWRIGAKEFEECDKGTKKAAIFGVITATCFSVTFALTGRFIVHIFTDNPQMINLVVKLLIIDIFLEFGNQFHLSEKYISHYFKEHFHITLSQYINHLRLEHARKLLQETTFSITEIAMQSGYENVSTRYLRVVYGMSPLKYRKRV